MLSALKLEKKENGNIGILLLLVAVATIGFFIFKSGSVKNYLSSMFSGFNPPKTEAATTTQTSYNMKVLVLKYFPLTSDGQNIDISVTGDVGDSYQQIRQRTTNIDNNLLVDLPKATTYLGYKDPNAKPSLTYQIVDTKEYPQAVPFDSTTRRPLYTQILNSNNVCGYVDGQGVSEIWMWAYQGQSNPAFGGLPYLNISESKMSSPFGDISNSYRGNDMPHCQHTYRLYTFNYGLGTPEAMHSWGHQIEAEISNIDGNLFGNIFEGPAFPQKSGVTGRCGSVHNPPNARFEYDYANPTPQSSDCLNWTPDGMGATTQISCANWGCSDINDASNSQLNYLIWLWQNLPGQGNTKTYQGKNLRNFWDIHGNWDTVMATDKTLTLAATPTPNPSPTTPPQVNLSDSFDRPNSTNLAGGLNWTNLANGLFGISSNQAYPVNGCPAPGYSVVDAQASDLVMQVTLPVNQQDLRIPFRVVDAQNMYWLEHKGNDFYELDRYQNGSTSILGQSAWGTAVNGDTIKIVLNGPSINVYVNGVLKISATDFALSGTKFGIGNWCNGNIRFDNFSLTSLPTPPSPSPTPSPTPTPVPTPMHCGGFVMNPKVCPVGYSCDYTGQIPDTGGVCVPTSSLPIPAPTPNPDKVPPTAPTALKGTVASSSQVNISWGASKDNVGVVGYDVYRNGVKIARSTTLTFGDANLAAATNYKYYIQAVDGAGNVSKNTSTLSLTTQKAPTTGNLMGVIRNYTGTPQAGVKITYVVGRVTKSVMSTSQGKYQILSVPGGTYLFTTSARNFISRPNQVSIVNGQTINKDLNI